MFYEGILLICVFIRLIVIINIRIDNNLNANFFKLFLSFCVMLDEIYYFLCYVISIFRIDIIKGMVGIM